MEEEEELLYSLHLIRVNVSRFITTDYTGKFVKALLIQANPELEEIFEKQLKELNPKPIRITPLLKYSNKEKNNGLTSIPLPTIPIYLKSYSNNDKKIPLEIGGEYYFLVGINNALKPQLSKALINLSSGIKMKYGEFEVKVRMREYQLVEVTDPPSNFTTLKVKFISPTLFRDPFSYIAGVERDRLKRFLPLPPVIFSVNVYELLRARYGKTIIRLGYAFRETPDILRNVKVVWYNYDNKLLPGIIGYAKFIRRQKLRKEVIEDFKKILRHAQIMGIGTSRGTGFGYAIIETE
ncbi:CRISPR system precrRNA processing endoribonuclease RAMP protein Cas6 [Sulfolobus sp. S-194]|uniref:CRISPR system precrRNA processing endoribonuclease RAMP protein Cas6 n=1 Tax=Sulfolobus sp. S-194 TaxID=2512240 RepID=UPI0014371252|nr:CRISPR system precrRNA processing endoribonuclease RAMP protein Cas6 [Sulfolobus sp. S-194]QIW22844.1 CRISPR system precrRNA processing endoribonuclease RAMP protein Cas6 [Sulfolobus sp. S-194]